MGEQRPVIPVVQALDQNGDGIIDAGELANAPESLKKLDKNGDGKLSSDEYQPQRPGGSGGPERSSRNERPPRNNQPGTAR